MLDGELDFEQLVLSGELIVGVNRGRSYSGVFDEVIKQHSEKLYIRSGSDFIGLFRMLENGRIHALPEFPNTIGFMISKRKMNKAHVMLINALGMKKNTIAYIAAPNNAWGKEKLHIIDNVMRKPETIKAFARLYAEWLPDQKTKELYYGLIKEYFKKNHDIDVRF